VTRALVAVLCAFAIACAPLHREPVVPAGDGPLVAIYKAVFDDGGGRLRTARLSIWAERPDRIHAELYGPLGGVAFSIDAGSGQACLVDVAKATAYVGDDGGEALESLLGVRVSAGDAVAALLDGRSPEGVTVRRDGSSVGAFPDHLRWSGGDRSLSLSLLRFLRGSAPAGALGTGKPPSRLAVRPMGSLERSVP
jgi:hypothetical protein